MTKLSGKKIYLRALEPEDLSFLYESENNTDFWESANNLAPYSQFVLKQYLERSISEDLYSLKELRLIICLQENQTSIGIIDLLNFDPKNKRAEIGILIAKPEYQKKGYASEALQLLIDYAFGLLDLHQLYCSISANNHDSIRLFSNKGFIQSGHRKDWNFNQGGYTDDFFFQLINPLKTII